MDGCLSLEEFLTAMHLVVLRRNSITLPDSLPTCLRPTFLKAKLEHSHKKQMKKEQVCRQYCYQDGEKDMVLAVEMI